MPEYERSLDARRQDAEHQHDGYFPTLVCDREEL